MTAISTLANGGNKGTKPNSFPAPKGIRLMTPMRALMVDDSEIDRAIHTKFLSKQGVEVVHATSGRQAIDLHLEGETFDLITMDDRLYDMDGSETVRALREMGVTTVIIGLGHEEFRGALLRAGANRYYLKPLLDMEAMLMDLNFI